MDNVLNNILNCDEHSMSDDNDEFYNETLKEASDMDVKMVSSIDSAHLQRFSHSSRDDEAAGNHANQVTSLRANDDTNIQLQTSSLLSVSKVP